MRILTPLPAQLVRLCVAATLLVAIVPSVAAAAPFATGFNDRSFLGADQTPWLQRAHALGASFTVLDVGWPVANTAVRPSGFDATNPGDPRYDFTAADEGVRAATAAGLIPVLVFTGAPRWAEGPGRPADAPPGTWRPDPAALHDYGVALARRYSGTFPDPARPGAALPRVRYFESWNEPNLATFLTPQWVGGRPASPNLYRAMLNAFSSGAKSVRADSVVVSAGTAPFGDPRPGGSRVMPLLFWRQLLCLRGAALAPAPCAAPARFDVLAHHPYSVGAPGRPALNADDASIADMGKLARLLRRARQLGRVAPTARKQMWVTEISYDSRPDPQGLPLATQAHWLEETLYELWREHVSAVMWFRIVDQPPVPSFAATNQSGVFFADARPKPAATAFRFPLVADRRSRSTLRVWTRSPVAGLLRIRDGGGRTIARRTVRAGAVATFSVRRSGRVRLTAAVGSERSLSYLSARGRGLAG